MYSPIQFMFVLYIKIIISTSNDIDHNDQILMTIMISIHKKWQIMGQLQKNMT